MSLPPLNRWSIRALLYRGVWIYLAAALLVGCAKPQEAQSATRESYRAAVVMVARAVKLVDVACAGVAQQEWDSGAEAEAIALARKCSSGYDTARDALLAAQAALDAADAWKSGLGCLFSRALDGLTRIVDALHSAGLEDKDFPLDIPDAIKLAKTMSTLAGGSCEVAR